MSEEENNLKNMIGSQRSNSVLNELSSRRKKIMLGATALLYMASFCAFSTISPFYTLEALKKGSTKTISGLVFSAYPLVIFLVSPFVGKYLTTVGPVFVLLTGSFLEAGCEILFGFIDKMPSTATFVLFSFLIRILTAVGSALSQTAILAIVALLYKDNVSFVFGLMELSSGIGLMIGPSIGGVLYDAGGFYLPFVSIGVAMLILLVVVKLSIPSGYDFTKEEEKLAPVGKTFKIPGMLLMILTVSYTGIAISFFDSTLAVHLKNITDGKISMTEIGLFFLFPTGFYTIAAPLVGYLADRKVIRSGTILLIGHILSFFAYFFLGPPPFLQSYIKSSPLLVGFFLSLCGLSVAPILVPSIHHMQSLVRRAGMAVDSPMISLISGIYTGCFNIGFAIGPSYGGLMVEYSTFQLATFILSVIYILLAFVHFIFVYFQLSGPDREVSGDAMNNRTSMLANPYVDDIENTKSHEQ